MCGTPIWFLLVRLHYSNGFAAHLQELIVRVLTEQNSVTLPRSFLLRLNDVLEIEIETHPMRQMRSCHNLTGERQCCTNFKA